MREPMSKFTLRLLAVAAILGMPAVAAPASAEPAPEPAAASPWVELHASRARLVASGAKALGGARIAGLEVAMDEGWKTYWRMPGDAGVPPHFDWSASANTAAIKVLYPAPKRIPEAGGEVIGYKHGVLFPIEVTPQDPGKPVALKLALEVGICREICVPVTTSLTLLLPPAATSGREGAIAAAIERVPRPHSGRRPSDPELRKVAIDDGATGARLTIAATFSGSEGADVFVEAPAGLYVPMLRKEAPDAQGVVRFSADLSPDLVRDLKGETLTLTLVSEAGASEARWTVP